MVLIADSFSFSPKAGERKAVSTFVVEDEEDFERREVVSETSCCSADSLVAVISAQWAEVWKAAVAASAVSSANVGGM